MDDKEKQPFHELADKDKTRYYTEMSDYRGPKGVRGRKRRQRKDPNAPKRALYVDYSFLVFVMGFSSRLVSWNEWD